MIKKISFFLVVIGLAFAVNLYADDQYSSAPSTTTTKAKGDVTITVKLVDEAMLSKDKMAKVEVGVTGVKLMPEHKGTTHMSSHLHYQIDDSPIIVTTSPTLSFANLTSGKHTIQVTVVDAKHSPLAGPESVELNIP
jgi:hypothetical protein